MSLTAHQLAQQLLNGPDVEVSIYTSCCGCSGDAFVETSVADQRVTIVDYEPEAAGS